MSQPFITTFFNTRGGAGTTVLAVNTAAALQRETGEPVLLLDAKAVPAGDVAVYLKMDGGRTIADIAPLAEKTPGSVLSGYLPEKWEGMAVLSLFGDLLDREKVDPWSMRAVLGKIAPSFAFVVVDAGSSFDGFAQLLLELGDCIVVPLLPDVVSVEQTRQLLAYLQSEEYPSAKCELVINRANKRASVDSSRLTELLGRPVKVEIPDEPARLSKMVETGTPVFLDDARAPFSQGILKLAHVIEDRKKKWQPDELRWTAAIELKGYGDSQAAQADAATATRAGKEGRMELKRQIHKRLVVEMDFDAMEFDVTDPANEERLSEMTRQKVIELLDDEAPDMRRSDRDVLIKEIVDEAVRLGPLEELLADDDVNEIMVNRADQIYVERKVGKASKMVLTDKSFPSDKHLLAAIDRIVSRVGRRVDERSPMVDARLADGSRVNAIIPPLALQGPMLTIRKFAKKKLSVEDLIGFGSISSQMAQFLDACVKTRRNIIVSGGTGSGKTTLLNIMSNFIPEDERILTVEDSAELKLQQEHVGRLEGRPANIEGEGAVTIRDLVRNTLRMRPDRIVVGECRGGEALDMLQAMNTGHDGSLTTVHANSPRDAIARLTTLVMMAGMDLPERAIVEQIASAINIIVQQARLGDGSRKITHITEIVGLEGGVVTMSDIFIFKQTGLTPDGKIKGDFIPTGAVPTFFDMLAAKGIRLSRELFQPTG